MSTGQNSELLLEPRFVEFQGITGIRLGEAIELLLERERPCRIALHGKSAFGAAEWAQRMFPEQPKLSWGSRPYLDKPYYFSVNVDVHSHEVAERVYLASLDQDDVIRFMLLYSPSACQSVIARLKPQHYEWLNSDLYVWRALLIELSQQPDRTVEECLWKRFEAEMDKHFSIFPSKPLGERYANLLAAEQPQFYDLLWALQCIPAVLNQLAVTNVLQQLTLKNGHVLASPLDRDVILEVSRQLKGDPAAIKYLLKLNKKPTAAMASSILHQMQLKWHPHVFYRCELSCALFDHADWSNVAIEGSVLNNCELSQSQLTGLSISKSKFDRCDFSMSVAESAKVVSTSFNNCSFSSARLSRSTWENTNISKCDFAMSEFDNAELNQIMCFSVDFDQADLANSSLQHCYFQECLFNESDLRDALVNNSKFLRCQFKHCQVTAAEFLKCTFSEMYFEDAEHRGLKFENCQMRESIWTGSKLFDCSFTNSEMTGARLAEIEWQSCDFRGADLRRITFHFGSTRCGLVGSPYPSHGTRTGFYTDHLEEQYFKEPEQIRRAALIDCDLRDANLEGVDFYLVDLTGSKLNGQQLRQAIATGALGIS